jgi:tetratricopeptide (TPR) repeat protein
MKRKWGRFIPLFLWLAAVVSCTGSLNGGSAVIFSSPPYKKITDSIRSFPDNGELYHQRAALLLQDRQYELARLDQQKAWELLSNETTGLDYATSLLLDSDTSAAIKLLQECRNRFTTSSEFSRRLSELYAEAGNWDKAKKEYEGVLRKDSLDFMAWYELGLLSIRLQDTANALSALERSYRIHPASFSGITLAGIYSSLQSPRVLDICNDLLLLDSSASLTDALYLKGVYYSDKKQYAKALEQFNQCINADWKFTDAYIEKGILLYEMGNLKKALAIFEKATVVSPAYADGYYWKGRIQEKLNQTEEAKDNYLKALRLDPGITEARTHLQLLEQNKTDQ